MQNDLLEHQLAPLCRRLDELDTEEAVSDFYAHIMRQVGPTFPGLEEQIESDGPPTNDWFIEGRRRVYRKLQTFRHH